MLQLLHRGLLLARVRERIRIVRGNADRREDRSGARVERDDRALPVAEGVRRGLLDLLVDREHDPAGRGVLAEIPRFPNTDRVGGILSDERVGVGGLDAGETELG